MISEKQLANKVFDLFRASRCKDGQGIMMRSVRFSLMDKLNPKEAEMFFTVFNGLLNTGYIIFKDEKQEFLLLTKKGYDFIYDDDKISHFLSMPWIIPPFDNPNWSVSFNLLWRAIGVNGKCPAYITGPKFYSLAVELDQNLAPSYSQFYDYRKDKGLSLSRVDMFKDVLDGMSDEVRYEMYASLQNYIDGIENTIRKAEDNPFDRLIPMEASESDNGIERVQTINKDDDYKVYVSYSWSQSDDMDDICDNLERNSIGYKRDKKDCGYLQNIKHFEDEIARGKIVIAIISDKYLKSIHCMYELSSLVENGLVEERLFPIVYIENHDAKEMSKYMQYWIKELEERRELISTLPVGSMRLAIDELRYCDSIISNLSRFWEFISKFNTLSPKELREDRYKVLIDRILERLNTPQ